MPRLANTNTTRAPIDEAIYRSSRAGGSVSASFPSLLVANIARTGARSSTLPILIDVLT